MKQQESMNFLTNLLKTINVQDNCLAAFPCYYAVQSLDEIEDNNGEIVEVMMDRNIFLTRLAAEAYLIRNSYDFNKPRIYVKSFRDNHQIIKLFQSISAIIGIEWNTDQE